VSKLLEFNPDIWVQETRTIGTQSPLATQRDSAVLQAPATAESGRRVARASRRGAGGRSPEFELLEALAEDLSHGRAALPHVPGIVKRIRDLLEEPQAPVAEAERLVRSEPHLEAWIVQIAGSLAMDGPRTRAIDLCSAIARLGPQGVQGATLSFAVHQMIRQPALRSIALPLEDWWHQSSAVACMSQLIARRTKVRVEEAFLAGLLHGIGRLYILLHAVDEPPERRKYLLNSDSIAGWHPSIGKAVLENWGASEPTACAVNDQLDHERRVRTLDAADLTDIVIAALALSHAPSGEAWRDLPAKRINSFRTLNLSADDCAKILRHAQQQLGMMRAALSPER
jgi:HD-like signal output (HDOD) protein